MPTIGRPVPKTDTDPLRPTSPTMPLLSLNQAAREAGRSKATLLEAIRNGRLSAKKDEKGRYQIDLSELFRVYPVTVSEPGTKTGTDPPPTTAETALFRQKTELLERIIENLEEERDDLRRRLDDEAAERRRLTLMITHQPQRQDQAPARDDQPQAWPTPLTYWLAATAAALGIGAAIWRVWSDRLP